MQKRATLTDCLEPSVSHWALQLQLAQIAAITGEANVRGAFRVPDTMLAEVHGRRILLVDDVYTTGATVNAATRALKRAKAEDVDVLTFARVLPGDFQSLSGGPI